jgi:oligopeptidase B
MRALEVPLAQPPVARKVPRTEVVHGETRVDDYYWLRDKPNPEVAAYLNAENAWASEVMKETGDLQERLYKEMLGHIKETDLSVPYRFGGWWYYSRTEEGKQYPIFCRKKGSLDAPESVMLDLNVLGKDLAFIAIGALRVNDDGNLLAYSLDTTGFRQYTLQVKDLATGEVLPDRIEKTGSVVWAADGRTLFYTVEDAAKRHYRVYRHRLGAAQDDLVYEETDERFSVAVARSRSRAWLFLESASHTASEVRFLPADRPDGAWTLVAPREDEHEYDVAHHGNRFYIRTNSGGRNFRLASAPIADPRRENWVEVVPHRPDVMLEGMDFFAGHSVLQEREAGLVRLRVTDMATGAVHRIEFPEPAYSAGPAENAEFDTGVFRFAYESMVTPHSVFDYDMTTRERKLLKQVEVPGYDASLYVIERAFAKAPDGILVPLSIVSRKDRARDGSGPAHLVGYGSYGYPYPVGFSSNRLSLLDRGFLVAIAHVRGGGELGKPWHDDGRMMKKRNTFMDFIAAAEFLIARRDTSADRLVVEGGSAGGLLMGAVVNMRPDLFRAVVTKVPFVDVVNTMLDESLPLTVGEFEEWGNPKKKDEYAYIRGYCPYTNLVAGERPAILVKTSFNDSQVMYWEPAKYVAKMRELGGFTRSLLLKTNMAAGHGGASGRYDHLREIAFDYAFMLRELGIEKA